MIYFNNKDKLDNFTLCARYCDIMKHIVVKYITLFTCFTLILTLRIVRIILNIFVLYYIQVHIEIKSKNSMQTLFIQLKNVDFSTKLRKLGREQCRLVISRLFKMSKTSL